MCGVPSFYTACGRAEEGCQEQHHWLFQVAPTRPVALYNRVTVTSAFQHRPLRQFMNPSQSQGSSTQGGTCNHPTIFATRNTGPRFP
jgi:hypothetical protein